MERSKTIFGNVQSPRTYKKALKSKRKFMKKFGDDSMVDYAVHTEQNPYIGELLGVRNICITSGHGKSGSEQSENAQSEKTKKGEFDEQNGIIIGNIRMGFGHYRIAMAMASCAHAMGYTPYWMDLNSYPQTTATKVVSAQNDLYSLGSRISQKSRLFNHFVWEPMNYEGFRKLSYNASDQKNAELMAPLFDNIPKDIPMIGTHVWPAQAAIHGGMKYVVNAIPDNWPMGLHLAEGSIHTIQTHYAYQGYRILNGMDQNNVLNEMPENALIYTGHYIDHELVENIETDCENRKKRKENGDAMRFLLTIGGAGAQKEIFAEILKYLMPAIRKRKAVVYVNIGDYKNVWGELCKRVPNLETVTTQHFDDWGKTQAFATSAISQPVTGVHCFCHQNIFEAVYATNLLMRSTDVLVTKPSELAFYPIPKLFIKRIGGHEQWGAIHSAEIGDGTLECRDIPHTLQMIKLFLKEETLLYDMCDNIVRNKSLGIYDGAYKVVQLAMNKNKL